MRLSQEQLDTLLKYLHIADVLDENWVVKPSEKSRILTGHFGVIPWVISEDIARILWWISTKAWLETRFHAALKAWDVIEFSGWREDPTLKITRAGKDISILDISDVWWDALDKQSLISGYEPQKMSAEKLSAQLLQSGAFQLATGAQAMTPEGNFVGHFQVPKNYPFLIEGQLPFPFMKEIANQVFFLALSLRDNPNWILNWSAILLTSSHIAKNPQANEEFRVPWGAIITVTWTSWVDLTNPEMWVVGDYTAYKWKVPIFSGNIKWTKVPTQTLFQ